VNGDDPEVGELLYRTDGCSAGNPGCGGDGVERQTQALVGSVQSEERFEHALGPLRQVLL
jgi:hypothetical protein